MAKSRCQVLGWSKNCVGWHQRHVILSTWSCTRGNRLQDVRWVRGNWGWYYRNRWRSLLCDNWRRYHCNWLRTHLLGAHLMGTSKYLSRSLWGCFMRLCPPNSCTHWWSHWCTWDYSVSGENKKYELILINEMLIFRHFLAHCGSCVLIHVLSFSTSSLSTVLNGCNITF